MDMSAKERRQIENEIIFRRANEKVGIALDEVDAFHVDDGNPQFVRKNDLLLEFLCECSDENCTQRVPVLLSVYQKIHLKRSNFIVKPGHQVAAIEKVVARKPEYLVIRKNKLTSEPGDKLNRTEVNNT